MIKYQENERQFQTRVTQVAQLLGWRVYSIPDSRRATLSGYPDLTMWKLSPLPRLLFVELKTNTGKLSKEQSVVLNELQQTGAEVYVWRPKDYDTIVRLLQKLPL